MVFAWNPPGENHAALAAGAGSWSSSHAAKRSGELNDGITGRILFQTAGFAQTKPVPRGPNNHLCVPAANASHPSAVIFGSSTPKTMHTVDDQQHTILFIAPAVYFRQRLSDPGDGQPHAAAGVHPGDSDRSRLWSDRFANAFGYFIRRNRVVRVEERNFAPGRSTSPGGEPD